MCSSHYLLILRHYLLFSKYWESRTCFLFWCAKKIQKILSYIRIFMRKCEMTGVASNTDNLIFEEILEVENRTFVKSCTFWYQSLYHSCHTFCPNTSIGYQHSISLYNPYPELDVSAGGRLSDNPSAPPNSFMDLKGRNTKNTSE